MNNQTIYRILEGMRKTSWLLTVIVLIGWLIRTGVAYKFLGYKVAFPDEIQTYYAQAWKIAYGNGWGNYLKVMPLFPFLLAFIFQASQGDILQTRIILATLNTILIPITYAIGKEIFNKKSALFSAALVAVYPVLVFSAGLLLTESVFTIFMCLAIYCFLKVSKDSNYLLAAGLFLGLAGLTTSLVLPFFILSLIMGFYLLKKNTIQKIKYLCLYTLITWGTIGAWGIRNYVVIGEFTVSKSNMGEVLYLHNNEHASGFSRRENYLKIKDKINQIDARFEGKSATEKDKAFKREALIFIQNNPEKFLKLCAERFLNLWRFYTKPISQGEFSVNIYAYISILTYGPIFFLAILGMIWSRKYGKGHIVVMVYFCSMIFIFTLIRSSVRARLPLEPFLAIYAGFAIYHLMALIKDGKKIS